jgi:hypothetical protein
MQIPVVMAVGRDLHTDFEGTLCPAGLYCQHTKYGARRLEKIHIISNENLLKAQDNLAKN